MKQEKTAAEWKEILKKAGSQAIVSIWNLVCESYEYYDGEIYTMDEFNGIMYGKSPWQVADTLSNDFNSRHDYFRFDGYGCIESSNSVYDWIDLDDMADSIANGEVDQTDVMKILEWSTTNE